MHSVRLLGTPKTFQVGKILCLGRNYYEHIRELGNEVPDQPVIFIKPATSIIGEGEAVVIRLIRDCHHEVELAVLIGKWGKYPRSRGDGTCGRLRVAIDLTLRDVQNELKKKALEIAKGSIQPAPLRFRASRRHRRPA
jgi:5-carboxymethyl-2-hydroxymuconate isomerase